MPPRSAAIVSSCEGGLSSLLCQTARWCQSARLQGLASGNHIAIDAVPFLWRLLTPYSLLSMSILWFAYLSLERPPAGRDKQRSPSGRGREPRVTILTLSWSRGFDVVLNGTGCTGIPGGELFMLGTFRSG